MMMLIKNYWIVPGLATGEMITPQHVISVVCEHTNISKERILSRDRKKEVSFARHAIVYLIKHHLPKMILHDLGDIINRDHATTLNSIRVISNRMATEKSIAQEMETINAKILFKITQE